MATEKTPNYTAAQEAIIVALAAANGDTLDLTLAKSLADDPRMNDADGNPRNYRSIVAKISRMGIAYKRKEPTTKDGKPVTKKSDLVSAIATLAGVNAAKLDGMEKSPKLALETIRDALASRAESESEAANG
jgi:uncharacterized protein (DUF2147 family)